MYHEIAYNPRGVNGMTNEYSSIEMVAVAAFVAVAIGFVLFLQGDGFLQIAIDRAIEDGRVIIGMSREDVMSSWGSPATKEKGGFEILGLDEVVDSSWMYPKRSKEVYFNSDGTVIWVTGYSGD